MISLSSGRWSAWPRRSARVCSLSVSCMLCVTIRQCLLLTHGRITVPVPSFGLRMVCTACGIIGAERAARCGGRLRRLAAI
jgi:hypothetical protein